MVIRGLGSFVVGAFCGVALCFGGCAQAVGYRPMGVDGFGYTGAVRDDGTVKVTFKGNRKNTIPQARSYAMCRAGELVAKQGFPLMAIVDEDGETKLSGSYQQCSQNYFTKQQTCSDQDIYRPVVNVVVRGFNTPEETKGEPLSAADAAAQCSAASN